MTIPGSHSFDLRASATGAAYRISVALPPAARRARRSPSCWIRTTISDGGRHRPRARRLRRHPGAGAGRHRLSCGRHADSHPAPAGGITPRSPIRRTKRWSARCSARGEPVRTGGAEAFLRFIDADLKPAIAARFPADLDRSVLIGHSLGGLLGLHALLSGPGRFSRYALTSPPILWGGKRSSPARAAMPRGTAIFARACSWRQAGRNQPGSRPRPAQAMRETVRRSARRSATPIRSSSSAASTPRWAGRGLSGAGDGVPRLRGREPCVGDRGGAGRALRMLYSGEGRR
ncbi:MAG: alpha/beta hydrolase-fold protein [Sphingomonas sp.]